MSKLNPGDRVGFAAQFLRATGQLAGEAPQRRGTYLGDSSIPGLGHVRWDDDAARAAAGQLRYADEVDPEWLADVLANGHLIPLKNLARIGSARFVCNDL